MDSDDSDMEITPKKRRYRRYIFGNQRTNNLCSISLAEGSNNCYSSDEDLYHTPETRTFTQCLPMEKDLSSADTLSVSESDDQSLEDVSSSSTSEESDTCDTEGDGDEELYNGSAHSKLTAHVATMLFAVKHSLSLEAFSDLLVLVTSFLPADAKLAKTVYKLKQYLKGHMRVKEPKKVLTCETCGGSLHVGVTCNRQDCKQAKARVVTSFDLNVEEQLTELLKDEMFCKQVFQEKAHEEGIMTDVTDGAEHKRITELPKISSEERRLTLTMNTDGVAIFKSTKKGTLWPVYLAINELPVNVRFTKKYIITGSLYCQKEKPEMMTYLKPLVDTLKRLEAEGLRVMTPVGKLFVRVFLQTVTVDLPARAMVLNMKQFNGKFGCCYCEDEGANPPGRPMVRYFPFETASVQRQHETMLRDARCAATSGTAVKGVKGASALVRLSYVDLVKTTTIDWMHCVLLGVVKTILTMWCSTTHKGRAFYIGDKTALLNKRMAEIKTPDHITRQPREIQDYTHWKATECKDFLMHYAVPVVTGIQNQDVTAHFGLLTTAMHIFNMEEVSEIQIAEGENMLEDFCYLFGRVYDVEKQTMNVHMLRHMGQMVRSHGQLFQSSTFGFESMNHTIKSMVHGTRFVNEQICFAVGVAKCLPDVVKRCAATSTASVQSVMQRLGKNITSEDVKKGVERTLGALQKATLNDDDDVNLVGRHDVEKCLRVVSTIGTLHSQQYHKSTIKNSFTVRYTNPAESFGAIQYFLKGPNGLFAVIRKFDIVKNTLIDYNAVTIPRLLKYRGKLCKHIWQLHATQHQQLDTVPVGRITAKCVYMDFKGKVLSVPANVLEHN